MILVSCDAEWKEGEYIKFVFNVHNGFVRHLEAPDMQIYGVSV